MGVEGRLWCVAVKTAAAVTAASVWLCLFSRSVVAWSWARVVAVLAASLAALALRIARSAAAVSCSKSRRLYVVSRARIAVVSAVEMAWR